MSTPEIESPDLSKDIKNLQNSNLDSKEKIIKKLKRDLKKKDRTEYELSIKLLEEKNKLLEEKNSSLNYKISVIDRKIGILEKEKADKKTVTKHESKHESKHGSKNEANLEIPNFFGNLFSSLGSKQFDNKNSDEKTHRPGQHTEFIFGPIKPTLSGLIKPVFPDQMSNIKKSNQQTVNQQDKNSQTPSEDENIEYDDNDIYEPIEKINCLEDLIKLGYKYDEIVKNMDDKKEVKNTENKEPDTETKKNEISHNFAKEIPAFSGEIPDFMKIMNTLMSNNPEFSNYIGSVIVSEDDSALDSIDFPEINIVDLLSNAYEKTEEDLKKNLNIQESLDINQELIEKKDEEFLIKQNQINKLKEVLDKQKKPGSQTSEIIKEKQESDKSAESNKQDKKEEKQEEKKNKKRAVYTLDGKNYSINLETVKKVQSALIKLNNMIGLISVKNAILEMIVYYLQQFEKTNNNMLHTVIEGPPGVGKTELGKILAEIYAGLGIIPSSKFKLVKRTDMVGEYLGHTAQKTQRLINEADGGVLFIDEAYSLGNDEKRDSYSKEAIDVLNQNLSENKKKLICIIAGYEDELEKCFFSVNPGLRRRFPFKFHIENYTSQELRDIFIQKIKTSGWKIDDDQFDKESLLKFFTDNMKEFPHFGGDIETLVVSCKFMHSKRILGLHPKFRKILVKEDIEEGLNHFIKNKKTKDGSSEFFKTMFS